MQHWRNDYCFMMTQMTLIKANYPNNNSKSKNFELKAYLNVFWNELYATTYQPWSFTFLQLPIDV